MYQLERINTFYNYSERVVSTDMYIHDVDNVKDIFCKRFAHDKSATEMRSFVKKWSLTTLSIYTAKDPKTLQMKFGKDFTHCYVRPVSTRLSIDLSSKSIVINSMIDIALDSRFTKSQSCSVVSESPLTDDFLKSLDVVSKVGYKKV